MLDNYAGLKIIVDPHLIIWKMVQYKFPRSHRKRIAKKFRKLYSEMRRTPSPHYYMIGNHSVMMHPEAYELLKGAVEDMGKRGADLYESSTLRYLRMTGIADQIFDVDP